MSENTTTSKGEIDMTKKAEPRLKAVTEPAKGKATTEMEKAAANARQVLGDVLDFRQRQLVEQCTMLAEKVQQLHPWWAVDRQLGEAVNEATRALLAVAARSTPFHESRSKPGPEPVSFDESEIPF